MKYSLKVLNAHLDYLSNQNVAYQKSLDMLNETPQMTVMDAAAQDFYKKTIPVNRRKIRDLQQGIKALLGHKTQ